MAILLSTILDSWFATEGYEDLGEKDFIAQPVLSRVSHSRSAQISVTYCAVDGSGMEFKIQYLARIDATHAAQNQDPVRRHVYAVIEKPFIPGILLRKFEMQFVPTDKDLQDHLDTFQKEVMLARWLSLTYNTAYVGYMVANFFRCRTQKKPPTSPLT